MLQRDNAGAATLREVALVVALALATCFYWFGLGEYLSGLSNPLPMKFILAVSLVVGLVYEVKGESRKSALAAMLATALIFALSPWLAAEYREVYLAAIEELKSIKEAEQVIGVEYVRAVNNPAVGIGGCFGLALATLRIPFQGLLRKGLKRVFIPQGDQQVCAHCGQAITQSALSR